MFDGCAELWINDFLCFVKFPALYSWPEVILSINHIGRLDNTLKALRCSLMVFNLDGTCVRNVELLFIFGLVFFVCDIV